MAQWYIEQWNIKRAIPELLTLYQSHGDSNFRHYQSFIIDIKDTIKILETNNVLLQVLFS